MSRWRDSQLQVSENYSDSTKWRLTIFKFLLIYVTLYLQLVWKLIRNMLKKIFKNEYNRYRWLTGWELFPHSLILIWYNNHTTAMPPVHQTAGPTGGSTITWRPYRQYTRQQDQLEAQWWSTVYHIDPTLCRHIVFAGDSYSDNSEAGTLTQCCINVVDGGPTLNQH